MKVSTWFVIVTTFALGTAFGYLLPVIQSAAYRLVFYLDTGMWTSPC